MPTFLERYQAGDRVAVWDDLVDLGEGVRHELYFADAIAVAAETMRRARHNVEVLIQRLDAMGYRFLTMEISDENHMDALQRRHSLTRQATGTSGSQDLRRMAEENAVRSHDLAVQFLDKSLGKKRTPPLQNPEILAPPSKRTAKDLAKIERMVGGPLPLSLRAWYEQVGGVSLLGWHSALNPNPDEPAGLSGTSPDPLMIHSTELLLELMGDEDEMEDGRFMLPLAPDAIFKSGEGGGGPYDIAVPDKCADAIFGDGEGRTFVNYLRNAFQWGGFPGWECDPNPPREAIAQLSEGLLPI